MKLAVYVVYVKHMRNQKGCQCTLAGVNTSLHMGDEWRAAAASGG